MSYSKFQCLDKIQELGKSIELYTKVIQDPKEPFRDFFFFEKID